MSNKILNQIIKYLDSIGNALSSSAKEGYKILVQQEFVNGLVWTLCHILGIIMLSTIMIVMTHYIKKYSPSLKKLDEEDCGDRLIACLIGYIIVMVVLFIILIFVIFDMPEGVMHMLNPQYYAIKDIINIVKK